jgi:hypothetical protein
MPALVAGIHVFGTHQKQNVDGRDKPGHDDKNQMQAPESVLSGAVIVPGSNPLLLFGVVVGLLNSECP